MSTKPRSIGWLGTGRMGAAMAARLIDAGEDVTVWNRTPSKTGPLVARGARAVERITDLGGCDVVFVMVSTPGDLEEVVCGEHGLLSAGGDGTDLDGADRRPGVIVDCSTVSAEASARVRAAVNAAGAGFLAAPVSGNPHVVAEGGCCIVASGPAEVFERVRPYLEEIAKVAVHAGEEEQSRLVKLCHNLYLGMMVQALAEVTSLAEKGGTDRAAFLEFLGGTVVASDWVRKRTDALVRRDWTPTFTTELLRKDFDLGLDAARSLEVPMPVGAMVYQLIQTAIGTGLRHEDFLSLYELQAAGAALPADQTPPARPDTARQPDAAGGVSMSLQEFVPTPRFEEYSEAFGDFYRMERREDGVLLVRGHTQGGPVQLSVQNHRSLGQMLRTVAADPENEVLILTGSGEEFMMDSDPEGFALEEADLEYWAYEYAYKDGRNNVSALVNDLEIPTIGLLNGSGFHSEIVLMCDITLAADDATLFDLHYDIGSVPADGIHNAFQELLGVKRAAYALLTGEAITAQQALDWGMVNEVMPRDDLVARAYQIADHIMTQPRTIRRLTTQIVRRPWKQRIVSDLDGGFGIQMFGHLAKKRAVHGEQHIRSTVDYVREGRKNNFD